MLGDLLGSNDRVAAQRAHRALVQITGQRLAIVPSDWEEWRVAGPSYRMERHLAAVALGERPGPCSIRRTDHLQDFCQTMNPALAAAERGSEAPASATAVRRDAA